MADENKILIELVLDDGTTKKGFVKIEQEALKTGKKVGDNISRGVSDIDFSKSFASLKRELLTIGATILAAFSFKKTIEAASRQEQAIQQLNTALSLSGQYSKQASQDIQNFASSLQNVTRYGDEVILETMALIENLGNLDREGLKRATKATLDLASALRIDLASAATLVGKAAVGEVGSFSRYGIVIKKAGTDAETFANVLTKIETKFGGTAAAQLNTFAGAVDYVTNSFGDLLERMGEATIKSPALISVIKALKEEIDKIAVTSAIDKTNDSLKETINIALALGKAINDFIVMPLEVVWNIGKTLFEGFRVSAQGLVIAFADAALAIARIGATFKVVSQETLKDLEVFSLSSRETILGFVQSTQDSFSQIFDVSASEKIDNFLLKLQTAVDQAKPYTEELSNSMKEAADKSVFSFRVISEAAVDMGQTLKSAMVSVVSQSIQKTVLAIRNGQNAFDAFAGAVGAVMGDLAIKLGEMFIAAGIAIEATKILGGFAAIAAGAALIAVGTIMKAASGGGAAVPTSGGGVATGGGFIPDATVEQPITEIGEPARPQTVVNVEIKGDVLDSKESGMRIVEIIADHFDREGGVLVTA